MGYVIQMVIVYHHAHRQILLIVNACVQKERKDVRFAVKRNQLVIQRTSADHLKRHSRPRIYLHIIYHLEEAAIKEFAMKR